MKKIILKPKIKFTSELNLKNLSNINFEVKKIFGTKVLYNNKELNLSELFEVETNKNNKNQNELIISGLNENCDYLGWKWENGILKIRSNVGSFVGAKMTGGKIIVDGSCEHYVGSEMCGGEIIIKSNTLDFLGSSLPGSKIGMKGGLIIIHGRSRDYLCFNMRRGTVYVKGDVRNNCCNSMIAGTVILKKSIGENLGFGMKRGTILLNKKTTTIRNFIETSESFSTFLNLLNNYFFKNFRLRVFEKNDTFVRFLGDSNMRGLGEIIVKK